MKKAFLLLVLISTYAFAQITLKITSEPANTPSNSTIYVAGNFNGWNPGLTAMVADGLGNYPLLSLKEVVFCNINLHVELGLLWKPTRQEVISQIEQ